jgi:hypothetical protein
MSDRPGISPFNCPGPVVPEPPHPAPCRWPSSPYCTCGDADVLHRLEADVRVFLSLKERAAVVESLDPFARMACEHPEACTCDADHPGWAEHIAALTETNKKPRRTS